MVKSIRSLYFVAETDEFSSDLPYVAEKLLDRDLPFSVELRLVYLSKASANRSPRKEILPYRNAGLYFLQ